jgi:hypothetical protein
MLLLARGKNSMRALRRGLVVRSEVRARFKSRCASWKNEARPRTSAQEIAPTAPDFARRPNLIIIDIDDAVERALQHPPDGQGSIRTHWVTGFIGYNKAKAGRRATKIAQHDLRVTHELFAEVRAARCRVVSMRDPNFANRG